MRRFRNCAGNTCNESTCHYNQTITINVRHQNRTNSDNLTLSFFIVCNNFIRDVTTAQTDKYNPISKDKKTQPFLIFQILY